MAKRKWTTHDPGNDFLQVGYLLPKEVYVFLPNAVGGFRHSSLYTMQPPKVFKNSECAYKDARKAIEKGCLDPVWYRHPDRRLALCYDMGRPLVDPDNDLFAFETPLTPEEEAKIGNGPVGELSHPVTAWSPALGESLNDRPEFDENGIFVGSPEGEWGISNPYRTPRGCEESIEGRECLKNLGHDGRHADGEGEFPLTDEEKRVAQEWDVTHAPEMDTPLSKLGDLWDVISQGIFEGMGLLGQAIDRALYDEEPDEEEGLPAWPRVVSVTETNVKGGIVNDLLDPNGTFRERPKFEALNVEDFKWTGETFEQVQDRWLQDLMVGLDEDPSLEGPTEEELFQEFLDQVEQLLPRGVQIVAVRDPQGQLYTLTGPGFKLGPDHQLVHQETREWTQVTEIKAFTSGPVAFNYQANDPS